MKYYRRLAHARSSRARSVHQAAFAIAGRTDESLGLGGLRLAGGGTEDIQTDPSFDITLAGEWSEVNYIMQG